MEETMTDMCVQSKVMEQILMLFSARKEELCIPMKTPEEIQ